MAAEFIGLTVRITLADPPGEKVRGRVKDIGAGSQLVLSKACSISTGRRYPENLVIPAGNIADLAIESEENKQPFVDPAIVSYDRNKVTPKVSSGPVTQAKPPASTSDAPQQASDHPATAAAPLASTIKIQTDLDPTATLSEPFSQVTLEAPTNGVQGRQTPSKSNDISKGQPRTGPRQFLEPKKSNKRGGRSNKKKGKDETGYTPPAANDLTALKAAKNRTDYKGRNGEDQNGWATGDATDIQEMGDFNFAENLSKFDKRKLFDQMRQDDTTADEERLHTFNRLPRAGTAGGKNLHHTEMVLGSPKQKLAEHSSADDEVDIQERKGSDRSVRKILVRKQPSRPSSVFNSTDAHMTASSSLPDIRETTPMSRTSTIDRSFSRRISTQTQRPRPHFQLTKSGRPCPSLTPLQMLELEHLAISSFGLTEDILAENAAHAIAASALSLMGTNVETDLTGPGPNDPSTTPIVVILAGNHSTGSRAIAAARHLLNHRTRVLLVLLGLDTFEDLLEPVKRQLEIFRKCQGRVITPEQLQRTLSVLKAPVSLILDAMLGMHLIYDDLQGKTQTDFAQLALWANYYETAAISLDVPSGVDATTGAVVLDVNNPFTAIMTEHVLCLGAPKPGLLGSGFREAFRNAELSINVADIGIPTAAWKRFRKRGPVGVEFGGAWTVGLEVVDD